MLQPEINPILFIVAFFRYKGAVIKGAGSNQMLIIDVQNVAFYIILRTELLYAAYLMITYRIMEKEKYGRISLEDVSRQAPITGVENFTLSDNGAKIEDYTFDFQHPNMIEGIAFAICIQGTARVKINLQEYHIEPNTIVTLLPNYLLEICDHSDNWLVEFIFISFDLN